jgi:hypothetical protein
MQTHERIHTIRTFVPRLRALVQGLTAVQLTTAYNAPEWTIAQNVHHLVESHTNSYLRFKKMLTEDNPVLGVYDQDRCATLPDAQSAYLDDSLMILQGLHARWATMLDHIEDWSRTGYHPEQEKTLTLDDLLTVYANHCEAHLKQIQEVLDAMEHSS